MEQAASTQTLERDTLFSWAVARAKVPTSLMLGTSMATPRGRLARLIYMLVAL